MVILHWKQRTSCDRCIYLSTEVRNCTLDSMCELASQNPQFALQCQDSIADMFNDEIESVRLNAINSLKKLSQHLEIREDQLEIMLGVLQVGLLSSIKLNAFHHHHRQQQQQCFLSSYYVYTHC